MTELQLRLWCLWMCEEFAGMTAQEAWAAATEGSNMRDILWDLVWSHGALNAWEIVERMP